MHSCSHDDDGVKEKIREAYMKTFDPRAIERGLHWIFYKTEMKIWAVGCGLWPGLDFLKKGLGRL